MGELTETVYLVDDEPRIVKALARLLTSHGFVAKGFTSADAFLSSYDVTTPGCVILDLEMPGMSGLEIQEALSARGSFHPIMFLSGNADVPRSVNAMKNGAIDFLTKPVSDDTLIPAVRRAIDRDHKTRADWNQHQTVAKRCASLSRRERQVVDGIMSGRLNKQIADDLGIGEKTVKVHRARAIAKMGCRSSFDLVRMINLVPDLLPLTKSL